MRFVYFIVVTLQQLKQNVRCSSRSHCWSPALLNCPQVRGRCLRNLIVTPRKPNSAKRGVSKVKLVNGKCVIAKVSAGGDKLHRHATVLIRGAGYKDTPNVGYSVIRGVLECLPCFNKTRRRSRYGVKKSSGGFMFSSINDLGFVIFVGGMGGVVNYGI